MVKLNWTKIRNEYTNGHISQRKLAEKHNIPYSTLRDVATKEKWFERRQEQREKIIAKTEQKTAEKIAERESDLAANITKTAEELLAKLQLAIAEVDYCLVKEKRKYTRQVKDPETGKMIYVDVEEEETKVKKNKHREAIRERINKAELKQLTSALKDIQTIQLQGKGEATAETPNINITISAATPMEEDEVDEE